MWPITASETLTTPRRLTDRVRSQSSSLGNSRSHQPGAPMTPASFTRTSTFPNSSRTAATMPATDRRSVTSAVTAMARPPRSASSDDTASAPGPFRSANATAAPCSESTRLMPRPMPLAAPVTMAALPVRSIITSSDSPGEANTGSRYPTPMPAPAGALRPCRSRRPALLPRRRGACE